MKASFITIIAVLTATISKAFGAAVDCCECTKQDVDFLEVVKAGVVFGVVGTTILFGPSILQSCWEWYTDRRRKKFWEKWEEEKKESERQFYKDLWDR